MFRCAQDFLSAWEHEFRACLDVLRAIPDGAMGQAVDPGGRDLRRIAWHIVEGLIEMPGRMGLTLPGSELIRGGFIGDPPASMAEIAGAYGRASEALVQAVQGWSEADLECTDNMYGETWMRGVSLMVLITHQAHHRGQMTVLMRQAGLRVPEIYGPAREDWSRFGMEPPRV